MIVVGIPYLETDEGKREVLRRCVASLKGQDQVIILSGKTPTLARAINMLMEMGFSMGADYMIITNDDVELVQGSLKELCIADVVTSPLVNGKKNKLFHAHMFGISRSVYEKVGPQYEGYDGFYFDDSDYWMMIEKAGYEVRRVESVNILHPEPGRTLRRVEGHHLKMANNRGIFVKRWGFDNLQRVERVEE